MEGERLSLIATGDAMIAKRISVHREKAFLNMVDIIRDGDAVYTNLEMLVHDFEGYPAAQSGGTYMRAPYSVLEELKWMGFNIVSTANNHALDYTYGGLHATIRNLNRVGIAHSGTGRDLAEARAPAFLDTPQGRVALVSIDSSSPLFALAGEARRDMRGRPGVNPLRISKRYILDDENWNRLLAVVNSLSPLGLRGPEPEAITPETKEVTLLGVKFAKGEKLDVTSEVDEADLKGNIQSIGDARRRSDWVLVSHHSHAVDGTDREVPAKYVQPFAHACLDAGADAYIGHGPHLLQGIEVYEGRPIFYSLGNFVIQRDLVEKLPSDFYARVKLGPEAFPQDAFDVREKTTYRRMYGNPVYSESVIAVCRFGKHGLRDLRLYPVDMGFGKPRPQYGTPMLADEEKGKRIMERLARLSEPFGTKIIYEGGVGTVSLP